MECSEPLTLLGIETSCDETAASVIRAGKITSNLIESQLIHQKYGGVVPELAARTHQAHILPIVNAALEEAHITKHDLHAIGFTQGPGLLGALLVGNAFAKALAFALSIPLIALHHMQAHVLANFIDDPKPTFPFLCLAVSGGHTQIILVEDYLAMQVLGETQDDAVGEAFDKIAKLMGLGYPGGKAIDQYAQKGDPHAFTFPNTRIGGLNFSFSGIKTAFSYFIQQQPKAFITTHLADICASIQATLINMLLDKLTQAVLQTHISTIALAGGVASNSHLRKQLHMLAQQHHWQTFIPAPVYCTDNAAMVAMATHYKYHAQLFADFTTPARPRMAL